VGGTISGPCRESPPRAAPRHCSAEQIGRFLLSVQNSRITEPNLAYFDDLPCQAATPVVASGPQTCFCN